MFDKRSLRERGLITTGFHLPYNPNLKARASDLRNNMTAAERRLWDGFLRSLPFSVLRQKPIDNYIVDFYCPKPKLVIEVDGESHYTEEGKSSDEMRTEILEGYGLKVLRVSNQDVLANFNHVCDRINEEVHSQFDLLSAKRKRT